MKKFLSFLCCIGFVGALVCMALNAHWCIVDVLAHRPATAALYGAFALADMWVAFEALGVLSPRFSAWRNGRLTALKNWLSNYRLCREIAYAIAFAVPVLSTPVIWIAAVLITPFIALRECARFARSRWRQIAAKRREIERSYRIYREALAKAKANAEHDATHGFGLG
jgi:hypothetical protein